MDSFNRSSPPAYARMPPAGANFLPRRRCSVCNEHKATSGGQVIKDGRVRSFVCAHCRQQNLLAA